MSEIYCLETANGRTMLGRIEGTTNLLKRSHVIVHSIRMVLATGETVQLVPHPLMDAMTINPATICGYTDESALPDNLLNAYREAVSGLKIASAMPGSERTN